MTEQAHEEPKRGRGNPFEKPVPDLIPDTPGSIMRAAMNTPSKRQDDWEYLQDADLRGQTCVATRWMKATGRPFRNLAVGTSRDQANLLLAT